MQRPFTYRGLVGLVNDFGSQFRMLAFANCLLTSYLIEEQARPLNNQHFRIREKRMGKSMELTLSGNEIVKRIEEQASFYGIPFSKLNMELHEVFIEAFVQRSLCMVYESIKSYNDLQNPRMIRQLNQHDWFKMLRILRDHYSHFYNLGKTFNFPSSQPYKLLLEVSWNGFSIGKGQPCDQVSVSIGYTMELLDHCYKYLVANEDSLK